MVDGKSVTTSSQVNFLRSLKNLESSLATPISEPRDLSGIIKDFEMAYELSWKLLKKTLANDGHATMGAKDVYSKAFQLGYINAQEVWLEMIADRNQTAHVYDESHAREIVDRVKNTYLAAFKDLTRFCQTSNEQS